MLCGLIHLASRIKYMLFDRHKYGQAKCHSMCITCKYFTYCKSNFDYIEKEFEQ